jgi:photosystem II cytochrome c550
MIQRLARWVRLGWMGVAIAVFAFFSGIHAVQAAPDPYIAQYLKVQPSESATLKQDAAGHTQDFNYATLLTGKTLFGQNCQGCHVGGTTLASPDLPLSLAALQGATPPRDSIEALITYMRHPLSYNGDDDNYGCREIDEKWLTDPEVEAIAAFVLRAANVAPGWGSQDF